MDLVNAGITRVVMPSETPTTTPETDAKRIGTNCGDRPQGRKGGGVMKVYEVTFRYSAEIVADSAEDACKRAAEEIRDNTEAADCDATEIEDDDQGERMLAESWKARAAGKGET